MSVLQISLSISPGRLSDILGRKGAMLLGLVLFSLGVVFHY